MLDSRFDIRPLRHADTPLPLLIEAREPGLELPACLPALRALIDQQLLVAGGGDNCVRLLPPLNLTLEEAREAVARFEGACQAAREKLAA